MDESNDRGVKMSDTEGFDLWASVTGEEPAAAMDEVSTETESAPAEDLPLPDQQAVSEPIVETLPLEPAPEPTPAAPAFDPNDPAQNPHLADAEAMRQLRAHAAQIASQRRNQEFVSELQELADGDPERLQKLQGMIAQVATPLNQQSQQMAYRANVSEKTLAALWIAAQANLPEDQLATLLSETDELMQVEGVDLMQRKVASKRESQQAFQAALAAKDTELEELRRQLAARSELGERQASGADLVDGGTGTAPFDTDPITRQREAKDMDDYFASWPGRVA